jgi:hypothetical protein
VLTADRSAFDASRLSALEDATLETWLQPPAGGSFWKSAHPLAIARRALTADVTAATPPPRVPIPLLAARTRALREIGCGLTRFYSGSAATFVRSAGGDASRLVELLTSTFPAFRDATLYRGSQIFLYKRAQICVGDLWGAYSGRGLGAFRNIAALTTFADYRVPQLLRALNILVYSPELARIIDAKEEIAANTECEVELRAATVHAVELMSAALARRGTPMPAFQLDWLLWERGEAQLDALAPHHRTRTIFY